MLKIGFAAVGALLALAPLAQAVEVVKVATLPLRHFPETLPRYDHAIFHETIPDQIAESLKGIGANRGFVVLSRARIEDTVLAERTLSRSDLVDPMFAVSAGKSWDVDYLVGGTCRYADDGTVQVEIRVLVVGSGEDRRLLLDEYAPLGASDEEEAGRLFDFQEQFAQQVVETLSANITPEERDAVRRVNHLTRSEKAYIKYHIARDKHYRKATVSGYRDALLTLREAVLLDEQFQMAYAVRSQVHLSLFYELDKNKRGGLAEQHRVEALKDAERALALPAASSNHQATVHRALADYYLFTGDHQKGREHARQAVALNRNDPESLMLQGIALGLGSEEGAASAKRALELDPSNPVFLHSMGYHYATSGKHEDSEKFYKKALAYNSRFYPAFMGLGDMYLKMKEFEKAYDVYAQVFRLNEENYRARHYAGYALLGLKRYEEAREQLRETVRLNPDYGDSYRYLGIASEKTGRCEEAAAAYEKFLELSDEEAKRSTVRRALDQLRAQMASGRCATSGK